MEEQLFVELINFSWAIITLVFGFQSWIFLQEFKGNRTLKWRHTFLVLAFISNILATGFLYYLISSVLDQSLAQTTNLVADHIKSSRYFFILFSCSSFLLSFFAIIAWQVSKNDRGSMR